MAESDKQLVAAIEKAAAYLEAHSGLLKVLGEKLDTLIEQNRIIKAAGGPNAAPTPAVVPTTPTPAAAPKPAQAAPTQTPAQAAPTQAATLAGDED